MTIYLARQICKDYSVYIISRGYGRKSKGLREVIIDSHSDDVGDEPLMIKRKLPNIGVWVSEDRLKAIDHIESIDKRKKVYILDDAMQHRRLNGGFQLLLTEYSFPFFQDNILPLGRLRDLKSRAKSSNMIIATKCTDDVLINEEKRQVFTQSAQKYSEGSVLFSAIEYGEYYDYFTQSKINIHKKVIAVSGLAGNTAFLEAVSKSTEILTFYSYPDHQRYTTRHLDTWIDTMRNNRISQIITTEKDAVRLISFQNFFTTHHIQLIVLPIEVLFTENDNTILWGQLNEYIGSSI